ncbi:MAG: hypothetical protein AAGD05_05835 [Bacteroidota bacterium]
MKKSVVSDLLRLICSRQKWVFMPNNKQSGGLIGGGGLGGDLNPLDPNPTCSPSDAFTIPIFIFLVFPNNQVIK